MREPKCKNENIFLGFRAHFSCRALVCLKLILWLNFLKFYYAHKRKCHCIFAHPQKNVFKITGHRKIFDLFVNVVSTCTYSLVFHTSFHYLDVNIGLVLSPRRVWLTKQSVFCCTYFFNKHLNPMQTCNGLHIQNAWGENYVQLCSQ